MISKSLDETKNLAEKFMADLSPAKSGATIVGLYGDLGSGKTTFIKSVAECLGINPRNITSPTFVIIKTYNLQPTVHNKEVFKKLVHIDAYRLEGPKDIERLGWKDIISDSGNLVLIEWSERLGNILPKNCAKISFSFIDENTRKIVFN